MTTTRPSSQAFPGKIEAKVHSRSRNDRLRARRCTRRYAFCRAFLKNLFIFLRQYEYGLFSCFEWITPFCTYQNAPLCAIIPIFYIYIYIYRATKEETMMMMMMMSTTKEEKKKKKKKKTKVSATTTKKKLETFFPTSPRVRVVLRKNGASGRDRNANWRRHKNAAGRIRRYPTWAV